MLGNSRFSACARAISDKVRNEKMRVRRHESHWLWGLLAVLLAALGAVSWWLSTQKLEPERVEIKPPTTQQVEAMIRPKPVRIKTATLQPGRVVVLHTNRGTIQFVLYEKDCPKTTARIADLVRAGAYDGVEFSRAEDWVIQSNAANVEVEPMGIEVAKGLVFEKGIVGMARAGDVNSNTSVFFITTKPAHHLDMKFTAFGRVISGMDVARRIAVGDRIQTANLRSFSQADGRSIPQVRGLR